MHLSSCIYIRLSEIYRREKQNTMENLDVVNTKPNTSEFKTGYLNTLIVIKLPPWW